MGSDGLMLYFPRCFATSLVVSSSFVVGCGPEADALDAPTGRAVMPLVFGSGDGTAVEAEAMSLPSSAGKVFADTSASAGQALLVWSNATASITRTTDAISVIRVRARGDQCNGAPRLIVRVDGSTVLSVLVPSTTWTNYESSGMKLPAGSHTLASRATDTAGNVQPEQRMENAGGYNNTSWADHAVKVTVA